MRNNLYVIYDRKSKSWGQPFPAPTDTHAIRSLATQVNDKGGTNFIALWPEDFELQKIGSFDQVEGTMTALMQPETIVSAVTLKKENE